MRKYKLLAFANRALLAGFIALAVTANAQSFLVPIGGEYGVVGSLLGDQNRSDIAFNSSGGWVVWQDNATDGDGLGISARHLNSSLYGDLNVFRVNEAGAGEQENPKVAMLNDGGAVFVWQGGQQGFQKVFARFMGPDLQFRTGDILVNTWTNQHQIEPVVAVLGNGNVAIAWSSYGQDGQFYGVYGRVYSSAGTPICSEFQVNQSTSLNQNGPAITSLANGNFVVAWVGESAGTNSSGAEIKVDIYARVFGPAGIASGNEVKLTTDGVSAEVSVASIPSGGFIAAWTHRDYVTAANGMDVFSSVFDNTCAPISAAARVNSTIYGDQAMAKVAIAGTNAFIVWTSLGQDGSREGVYGRYMALSGAPAGNEIRVNGRTTSVQYQPSIATDGSRFAVVWSSFVGIPAGFDLYAQQYSSGQPTGLIAPPAPFVSAISSNVLSVTWPAMDGYDVAFYDLYVNSNAAPVRVTGIQTTITNVTPGTTNYFQLVYQTTGGQRSDPSAVAIGVTWGADNNGDGLPDDWQISVWGSNPALWPSADADSDGDGASNYQEFLAGTDPLNRYSVLRTRLSSNSSGFAFAWNTRPGFVYQVQTASSLGTWQNYGLPRFAHDTVDSITIGPSGQSAFYRVIRVR